MGDTFSTESSDTADSLAAALSLYHPRGCKAGGYHEPGAATATTQPQALASSCRGAPVPAGPGGQEGSAKAHPTAGLRAAPPAAPGSAQTPATNRLLPPLRSDGGDCAAGEREGGSSVPPRNTRKTLPRLKFNKAIGTNAAAYSLNTVFLQPLFCLRSFPIPVCLCRRSAARRQSPAAPGTDRPAPSPGSAGAAPELPQHPQHRGRTPGPAGRPGGAGGGGAPAGFARGRRRDTA